MLDILSLNANTKNPLNFPTLNETHQNHLPIEMTVYETETELEVPVAEIWSWSQSINLNEEGRHEITLVSSSSNVFLISCINQMLGDGTYCCTITEESSPPFILKNLCSFQIAYYSHLANDFLILSEGTSIPLSFEATNFQIEKNQNQTPQKQTSENSNQFTELEYLQPLSNACLYLTPFENLEELTLLKK